MNRKVIVFDFDKTLSYEDSLVEIFKGEMKVFVLPFYFLIRVMAKCHLLSRTFEKEFMLKTVFQNKEEAFIEACHCYAGRVSLNPIYKLFLDKTKTNSRVIVLSASAQYFLDYLLKDVKGIEIIGTTFKISNGIIKGIDRHPSGKNKKKIIDQMGITSISECYYDSKSDECLLPISESYFKVHNGVIIKSNGKTEVMDNI